MQKKSPGGACNFIKKETLAQVFPGEFCEISKNTFFYRAPPMAVSGAFTRIFTVIVIHSDVKHKNRSKYQLYYHFYSFFIFFFCFLCVFPFTTIHEPQDCR